MKHIFCVMKLFFTVFVMVVHDIIHLSKPIKLYSTESRWLYANLKNLVNQVHTGKNADCDKRFIRIMNVWNNLSEEGKGKHIDLNNGNELNLWLRQKHCTLNG